MRLLDLDAAQWTRLILMILQVQVVIVLGIQLLKNWKRLHQPLRMLELSVLFMSVFIIDAGRNGLVSEFDFSVRLIAWAIGLFILYGYAMQPFEKRYNWRATQITGSVVSADDPRLSPRRSD